VRKSSRRLSSKGQTLHGDSVTRNCDQPHLHFVSDAQHQVAAVVGRTVRRDGRVGEPAAGLAQDDGEPLALRPGAVALAFASVFGRVCRDEENVQAWTMGRYHQYSRLVTDM